MFIVSRYWRLEGQQKMKTAQEHSSDISISFDRCVCYYSLLLEAVISSIHCG